MWNPLLIQVGQCHGRSHSFIGLTLDCLVLFSKSDCDNIKGTKGVKHNIWLCLQVLTCLAELNKRRHGVLWEGTGSPTLSTSSVPCLLLPQVRCWEQREALAQIPACVEHYIDVSCISLSSWSAAFHQITGRIVDHREERYCRILSMHLLFQNVSKSFE